MEKGTASTVHIVRRKQISVFLKSNTLGLNKKDKKVWHDYAKEFITGEENFPPTMMVWN